MPWPEFSYSSVSRALGLYYIVLSLHWSILGFGMGGMIKRSGVMNTLVWDGYDMFGKGWVGWEGGGERAL